MEICRQEFTSTVFLGVLPVSLYIIIIIIIIIVVVIIIIIIKLLMHLLSLFIFTFSRHSKAYPVHKQRPNIVSESHHSIPGREIRLTCSVGGFFETCCSGVGSLLLFYALVLRQPLLAVEEITSL